jgi:uracil-DNA glycosylase
MAKMLMEKKWLQILNTEFEKPYMKKLEEFLIKEKQKNNEIFPPSNEIFNAFCYTPFSKVKVVIIGQDPYHGQGQAHGLSFSVQKGVKTPPSLKNIYKEIKEDLKVLEDIPTNGCLDGWAKQGVLLLNATLTVTAQNPRSHYGKGWETFTDVVVEKLSKKKDPVVFILWGRSAQEKVLKLLNEDTDHHLVLTAAHPSFYSAAGFFGCKHFSKTNEFLKKNGKTPIDWQIT